MKNDMDENHKDYLAAIPQLNDKQKDELVDAGSYGIKKISIGFFIFLILLGFAVIACALITGLIVGDYTINILKK